MRNMLCACAALLMLSACVTPPQKKYEWGNYEQSMYNYYKDPANPDALLLSVEAIIRTAESANRTVPPGLYAEYGYLLMQQGKSQEAVSNFEKEKRKWPESALLMDKMSRLAQSAPATQGEVKK